MERLFPALPGMERYIKALRKLTKKSNDLLLQIVEDLSYVFSDGKENTWNPKEVERLRKRVLKELRAKRDAFVFRNEAILLEALDLDATPALVTENESVAMSA
jgi:hypothetical protein